MDVELFASLSCGKLFKDNEREKEGNCLYFMHTEHICIIFAQCLYTVPKCFFFYLKDLVWEGKKPY